MGIGLWRCSVLAGKASARQYSSRIRPIDNVSILVIVVDWCAQADVIDTIAQGDISQLGVA